MNLKDVERSCQRMVRAYFSLKYELIPSDLPNTYKLWHGKKVRNPDVYIVATGPFAGVSFLRKA